jgi:hypothetical protein
MLVGRIKPVWTNYFFDDGTLQGWSDVNPTGTYKFTSQIGTGTDTDPAQSLPNFVGIDDWAQRDNNLSTIWIRSPKFKLWGPPGQELTFYLSGGAGFGVGALPQYDSSVPTGDGSTTTGFMGLALRDDVTGEFLLKASRAANANIWTPFAFDVSSYLNDNKYYTLDLIDFFRGSWGFVALDTVRIPGC